MTQIKKTNDKDDELLILEQRKVKALEKISNSLSTLTVWVEEIDKEEWGNRIQFYLAEFHNKIVKEIVFKDGQEVKISNKKIK